MPTAHAFADAANVKLARAVHAAEVEVSTWPLRIAACIEPFSPHIAGFVSRIDIDAPLTLGFAAACALVHILGAAFGFRFTVQYFSVSSMVRDFRPMYPLSYWRLVSHIFGHSSWEHLNSNMINLLLVGPACEREFTTLGLTKIYLWTAVCSALAHMLLGAPDAAQLGASGLVFMLILLNSLLSARTGRYPLTFIVQVGLWVNKEVVAQMLQHDKVSHIAHLSGALVGTVAGYQLHSDKVKAKAVAQWQAARLFKQVPAKPRSKWF